MNLYKLTQHENNVYNIYDSCIVTADSEAKAREILPADSLTWENTYGEWADKPEQVVVELLGTSIDTQSKCILASFKAW